MTRTVALLAYEGSGLLDISGPGEVFAVANVIAGGEAYRTVVVSPDGRDAMSSAGFRIGVAGAVADLDDRIDTLVVPGTWAWATTIARTELIDAVGTAAGRSTRVAGVCVGAFLLGAVGLLDGRRATTHWHFMDDFAERFPAVLLQRDPIFVRDDDVYTSAGVSAGIDLALALVEADHGAEVARQVAQHLVVFMQRPGGQAQFSVRLQSRAVARGSLRDVLDAVAADPAGDHRLTELARRAGFSSRHLTRVFARELGTTPGRYVERIRVEAARSMLADSDASLETIARDAGLGSAETLRRSFTREVGVTPHTYRQRFATTGIGALAR